MLRHKQILMRLYFMQALYEDINIDRSKLFSVKKMTQYLIRVTNLAILYVFYIIVYNY